MKQAILNADRTRNELSRIRTMIDVDLPKAKQILTNLINNIANKRGKCFEYKIIAG